MTLAEFLTLAAVGLGGGWVWDWVEGRRYRRWRARMDREVEQRAEVLRTAARVASASGMSVEEAVRMLNAVVTPPAPGWRSRVRPWRLRGLRGWFYR